MNALFALVLAAALAQPPCTVADAVLDEGLDSGSARTGQPVRFTVTSDPAGGGALPGYGIVGFARGARRAGYPGQIGIETRFVVRADGSHVPATLVRLGGVDTGVIDGRTLNAPVVLSAVGAFRPTPYQIAAGVVAGYNALHFGSQAVLPRGTPLRVVLGDDYITGACSLP